MDKFVKRYYHYEKDEHGNDIKVANMISQKNPEHSEACSMRMRTMMEFFSWKRLKTRII